MTSTPTPTTAPKKHYNASPDAKLSPTDKILIFCGAGLIALFALYCCGRKFLSPKARKLRKLKRQKLAAGSGTMGDSLLHGAPKDTDDLEMIYDSHQRGDDDDEGDIDGGLRSTVSLMSGPPRVGGVQASEHWVAFSQPASCYDDVEEIIVELEKLGVPRNRCFRHQAFDNSTKPKGFSYWLAAVDSAYVVPVLLGQEYAATPALVNEWNAAGAKRFPISTTDPINVTANVIVDRNNSHLLQALASDSDDWIDHVPESLNKLSKRDIAAQIFAKIPLSAAQIQRDSASFKNARADYVFKLLLTGDAGVGKSSLLLRFAEDDFQSTMSTSIGVDFRTRKIKLAEKVVKLQIWDTAGQERFQSLSGSYYRSAHGVVLAYDPTRRTTFDTLEIWMREIVAKTRGRLPTVIVATKGDLVEERQVEPSEGEKFAEDYGIPFVKTSSKTGDSVDEVFQTLSTLVMEKNLSDFDGSDTMTSLNSAGSEHSIYFSEQNRGCSVM